MSANTGNGGLEGALAEAVALAGEPAAPQGSLFDAPGPIAARGAGRPFGTRNKRIERYAAELIREHGDPLAHATAIAARRVDAPGELDALARELGMKRKDAADFWLRTLQAVLPYLHQRQAQAIYLAPGAPGADDPVAAIIDVTPNAAPDGAPDSAPDTAT